MDLTDRPTIVDLFCGAGGLSEGFRQAGFKTLLGVDYDPIALKTYQKYHNKAILMRIEELTADRIIKEIGSRKITVLAAGPPCQAFSKVAVAKLRSLKRSANIHNPLDVLYKEFMRLVKVLKPQFFVMENVGRMFSVDDHRIKKEIVTELQNYNMTFYYENVADFGVPQIRKRGIVIGNTFDFSEPIMKRTHYDPVNEELHDEKKPYETVRSAISDLPKIKAGGGKEIMRYRGNNLSPYAQERRISSDQLIYNHIARMHSDDDLKIFKMLKQGQWLKDLPERYNRYRKDIFLDKYKKQSWDKPSSTILAHLSKDGLMFIHPDGNQNRSFTPREAARLQSFDDMYIFEGPKTKQYTQIGNAVPPIFAKAIATAILESINKKIVLVIPQK